MISKCYKFSKFELTPKSNTVLLEAIKLPEFSKIKIADSDDENKKIIGIVKASDNQDYKNDQAVLFNTSAGYSITLEGREFHFVDPEFIYGLISYA